MSQAPDRPPIQVGKLYVDKERTLESRLNEMYKWGGYIPTVLLADTPYYKEFVFVRADLIGQPWTPPNQHADRKDVLH